MLTKTWVALNKFSKKFHLKFIFGIWAKCYQGNEIEKLLTLAKEKRDFLQELHYIVMYEVHQQRFFHQTGSLYQLLDGPKQQDLIDLYKPLMSEEQ